MATIVEAAKFRSRAKQDAPSRILLHNISWELYEQLRAEWANRCIRMTYDNGELELMSPSQSHGEMEERFPLFVTEIADALNISFKSVGTTTWKLMTAGKGKEADACFYFAHYERIRHKQINLEIDPPPDLAIEVEVSRSAIDALDIYAAIGIPEIWRFDGEALHIHVRQAHGLYLEVEQGLTFPFLHRDEIVSWMTKAEEMDDDLAWKREVREWACIVLAPRLEPRA